MLTATPAIALVLAGVYPCVGLPDGRYFTAKLVEAGERPVFRKSVPEAGILKINNSA